MSPHPTQQNQTIANLSTKPLSFKILEFSPMAPSISKTVELNSFGLVNGNLPLSITLEGSNFLANGHPFLTEVPENIIVTPSPIDAKSSKNNEDDDVVGCFVGFHADEPRSRHVASLGKLRGIKFMSIFRFKVWWTTHWVGSNGHELEHETQMMLLDKNDQLGRPFVLILPILQASFRASLQPGLDDYVDVCMESGSTRVSGSSFGSCLYVHVGHDPYQLLREATKVVRMHLGTFKLLEEKTAPGIYSPLKIHHQNYYCFVLLEFFFFIHIIRRYFRLLLNLSTIFSLSFFYLYLTHKKHRIAIKLYSGLQALRECVYVI